MYMSELKFSEDILALDLIKFSSSSEWEWHNIIYYSVIYYDMIVKVYYIT